MACKRHNSACETGLGGLECHRLQPTVVTAHIFAPSRTWLRKVSRMETSLHRQLKSIYAGQPEAVEMRLGKFRIDAVRGNQLIEVQHGSLGAIRSKIQTLLTRHEVLVVKPLIVRKTLIQTAVPMGPEVSRRKSPKTANWLSLFEELVYFTSVFPHRNLTLEFILVEVEEIRRPGHGKRRRWRKNDYIVDDQRLVQVTDTLQFRTCQDLLGLLPKDLPQPFHTGHLAQSLTIKRHIAQRIAYCLRKTGATTLCGKEGNALLYKTAGEEEKAVVAKSKKRVSKAKRKSA